MSRFLLFQHQYFGSGGYHSVEELPAGTTKEQAEDRALIGKGHLCYGGHEVCSIIVEIGEKETTCFAPRKLTWKERLTGRINPDIVDAVPTEKFEVKLVP